MVDRNQARSFRLAENWLQLASAYRPIFPVPASVGKYEGSIAVGSYLLPRVNLCSTRTPIFTWGTEIGYGADGINYRRVINPRADTLSFRFTAGNLFRCCAYCLSTLRENRESRRKRACCVQGISCNLMLKLPRGPRRGTIKRNNRREVYRRHVKVAFKRAIFFFFYGCDLWSCTTAHVICVTRYHLNCLIISHLSFDVTSFGKI